MSSGRPSNEARMLAQVMGEKTYEGAVHDKCGTRTRYVKGSGCVHCARVIATEQREARALLKAEQQAARQDEHPSDIVQEERHPDEDPTLDPYTQSIEDLM